MVDHGETAGFAGKWMHALIRLLARALFVLICTMKTHMYTNKISVLIMSHLPMEVFIPILSSKSLGNSQFHWQVDHYIIVGLPFHHSLSHWLTSDSHSDKWERHYQLAHHYCFSS